MRYGKDPIGVYVGQLLENPIFHSTPIPDLIFKSALNMFSLQNNLL
jgi:hypothetical protein